MRQLNRAGLNRMGLDIPALAWHYYKVVPVPNWKSNHLFLCFLYFVVIDILYQHFIAYLETILLSLLVIKGRTDGTADTQKIAKTTR